MSLSGNLKTVSFPDILQLLATGKKTGTLEVRTKARQKEVVFSEGNIVHATSVNSNEDLLGNMLLRRGRISKSELDRAVKRHQQTGRQLGATLIDMNLFDEEEIAECLRLQIEEIVYNLFAWDHGEFVFHEDRVPDDIPSVTNLNTMNVVMEGTRRIDEWHEIQKALPDDDAILGLAESPAIHGEDVRLSLDEFKVLALINGERTLPDLVRIAPMGEFVTYRAVYQLGTQGLIEVIGHREDTTETKISQEEAILVLIFKLFNACFADIRSRVAELVGPDNGKFDRFAAQYQKGLMSFFPGRPEGHEGYPSLDKFLAAVAALPEETRYHQLVQSLQSMLTEHLEYVYALLGAGAFRSVASSVKRKMVEPLATQRELVRQYSLEESFYQSLRRADRVVRMIRG